MYFASSHLISMEITLGFLVKMGTEMKKNCILICYLKRETLWRPMQLPFLRHISPFMSGRASPLLPAYQYRAGSSPSARQRNSAVRALSMAWAGFTQVFLTPVDMIKLKMMENCQLKTPFQTVCLITVGFCPMVLSWCGPVTPGMPKGFLTNPVQLFWQRYIIPELKWQLFFYCFILFYFMEVTAFAEKQQNLQMSQVKLHNCLEHSGLHWLGTHLYCMDEMKDNFIIFDLFWMEKCYLVCHLCSDFPLEMCQSVLNESSYGIEKSSFLFKEGLSKYISE